MKRPGLGFIISTIANVLLSAWLVENYFYDVYFQTYVNTALSQINLFLLVGILAIGTAGIGYFYIRKRGPSYSVSNRQRGKLPRQGIISPSRASTQVEGRGLQAASRTVSETKHTAYAVPTLTKAPAPAGTAPGSFKGSASGGMTAVSRPPVSLPQKELSQSVSFPETRVEPSPSESLRFQGQGMALSRPVTPPTSQALSKVRPPPGLSPGTESPPPSWVSSKPQFPPPAEKSGLEKAAPFAITGVETGPRPRPPAAGQGVAPTAQSSGLFVSKWKRPDEVGKQSQWVDPVPKQQFSIPQKWTPPVAPGANPRPGVSPLPQRTGQGILNQPFAQQRPAPRPLAFPGALGAREFRPDDTRTVRPSGGSPPSSPSKYPGPTSGAGGTPSIQVRTPGESIKVPPTNQPGGPATGTGTELSSPSTTEPKKESYTAPPVGEMDWDTALDTILKTLRKDKLAEKD